MYGYDIFYGKNYSYFLIDNKMHKCLPKVENRNLELLEVYKKNYTQSIVFNENNLRNFFAIVVPKIKDNFEIKNKDDITRLEGIILQLLKKLIDKYYKDYQKNFEQDNSYYKPLEKESTFNIFKISEDSYGYTIQIEQDNQNKNQDIINK